MFGSGNWIDPALVPGVAAADAPDAEPDTADHAVMGNGVCRITGTGGVKAALPPDSRIRIFRIVSPVLANNRQSGPAIRDD